MRTSSQFFSFSTGFNSICDFFSWIRYFFSLDFVLEVSFSSIELFFELQKENCEKQVQNFGILLFNELFKLFKQELFWSRALTNNKPRTKFFLRVTTFFKKISMKIKNSCVQTIVQTQPYTKLVFSESICYKSYTYDMIFDSLNWGKLLQETFSRHKNHANFTSTKTLCWNDAKNLCHRFIASKRFLRLI